MCPYGSPCRCRCPRCHDSGTIWSGGRLVRCPGARVTAVTDDRAIRARDCHEAASATDSTARQHRDTRDAIVRELRAEDPRKWTMSRLAAEVGCSKELIAYILKTEARGAGADPDVPVPEPGA